MNNDLAWFLATSPEPCLRDAARAVRLAKKVVTAHAGVRQLQEYAWCGLLPQWRR